MSVFEGKTDEIIKADSHFAARIADVDEVHHVRMSALRSAETRIKDRARTIERHPDQYSDTSIEDLLDGVRSLQTAERERHQLELNRIHEEYLTQVVQALNCY